MFDVEAVFIFPWAVRVRELGTFGLVEAAAFILILALGLVYAWRKGVLRWV
jgi:NADH-quinone oxidoreductase subunit A